MSNRLNWNHAIQNLEQSSASVQQQVALELLPILARQNALARPLAHELMCNLYHVAEAWEADLLTKEEDVVTVTSKEQLAKILQTDDIKTVLILQDAGLTRDDIITQMRCCTTSKTIFWQRKA